MLKPMTFALALAALLGGCGGVRDSALNPFNWFGRSQDAPVEQSAEAAASPSATNPLIPKRRAGIFARERERAEAFDPTTPMPQITELRVERVPGGAIIRARGLDTYVNSFDAGLEPNNAEELPEDGVLVYSFRRQLPEGAVAGGAEAAREVTVARFVTDQTLRNVRSIRVEAASNARVVRR